MCFFKDPNEFFPVEKDFKVPNVDNIIEEGKKSPTKFHKIVLRKNDFVKCETDKFTASVWPSVSGDVLKNLAGKVSADFDFLDEENDEELTETVTEKSSEEIQAFPSVDADMSAYGVAYSAFGGGQTGIEACHAVAALCEVCSIDLLISNFILPLQGSHISGKNGRVHCSLNINTETGRFSARRPNLQNQPALEKDRYKIPKAFIAAPGNSLIVADYGQLELRILAHLANCTSMLDVFRAGGDFHSRTAMNMYPHIRKAVEQKDVLLEWHPKPGQDKPPVPLLKDAFASERRKAKMLNFSITYGKTTVGLARDWKEERKKEARQYQRVYTLLGRARHFPSLKNASSARTCCHQYPGADYDNFGLDEFSFGNKQGPREAEREGPVLSKLGSSSTAELHPKASVKTKLTVKVPFYLILEWRCLFIGFQPRIIACAKLVAAFSMAVRFLTGLPLWSPD
ncbi:DNA polymerase i a chloroplastic/mitochondrial [Phtheirospermum japonicum]|uniref:DNA polymerase i a chloroplastic/mitochondrial n=1 Tax=Phtheirospermum japonicum TaxID=374723 RepID=A0A830CAE2_9LAMI|nr:DNA polymerase i a chloroplastic/mitochondrial [Phtheirospermum japonicum]